MGLFSNPLGHAGYPPGVTGTPTTQPASIRAATAAEAAAGVLDNCYISPATAQSATALDFASPPVLGFGSTTPRPVHGTTIDSTTTITAGTSLTATLGNITATNGNIVRTAAGNKDVYGSVGTTTTAGANSAGTVILVGGTATVATTAVTAASQIRLYRQGIGATGAAALGFLTLGTKSAGVSFIINAVQPASATALQATDVSSIGWEIVN
jgi:hypothetical protein